MEAYEKALDTGIAESKLLITLSSAFLTLSVSILKLISGLTDIAVYLLIAATIVSAASAIAGAVFLGAITSFLRRAANPTSSTYKDALGDKTVKGTLKLQWVLFTLGITALGLSIAF